MTKLKKAVTVEIEEKDDGWFAISVDNIPRASMDSFDDAVVFAQQVIKREYLFFWERQ